MPYIPHTPEDVTEMLAVIGAASIEDLFDEIPTALKTSVLAEVPTALSEMEITRLMAERAAEDGRPLSFLGAGAYEHHIPAPVWPLQRAANSIPRIRPIRRRPARVRCR